MLKNTSTLLKSCEKRYGQTSLPDSREFKGDLLAAVRKSLSDLYVLENYLVEALDRDEGGDL